MGDLLVELRARRVEMEPKGVSGMVQAVQAVLESSIADRIRGVIQRPPSDLIASWAEQARLIQERAAAEAERAEKRKKPGSPKDGT